MSASKLALGTLETVRYVPYFVAPVLLGAQQAKVVDPFRVQLGNRVEIDTSLLAGGYPDIAAELVAYWALAQRFWDEGPSGPWVAHLRDVLQVRQIDGGGGGVRVDLREQLDALESLMPLAWVPDAFLGSGPDYDAIAHHGAPYDAIVEEVAAGKPGMCEGGVRKVTGYRLKLTVADPLMWPAALGGAPTNGELRRLLTLEARYATWRDRKVRRLAYLKVEVEEVWPDPHGRVDEVKVLAEQLHNGLTTSPEASTL